MANVKIPTRAMNKGLQLAEDLVYHFFEDEISWTGAWNLSKRWTLSWHNTRRFIREQGNTRSPRPSRSLQSPPPPCTPRRSITPV